MASPKYPKSDTPTWLYGHFQNNINWAIPMRTLVTLKDAPTAFNLWTGTFYWSVLSFPLYTFLMDTTMD